jgi:formate-dependent nitrite reductase membrane component NrfD
MSNPLVTPQFVPPLRPLNELYNVVHDRPFSLLFANYSWALGVAGALALIWAVNAWRGRTETVELRFTMPLVVALIGGGFVNVLSEVNQPGRLIYGYILGWYNWDTAIIKYGIILLPLFLVLAWWLSFQSIPRARLAAEIEPLGGPWRKLADFFSLWSRHYSLFESRWLKPVLVIVVFLGLFAPLYSAIFLMNEHGVPVWNSPAEAVLFLASAIAVAALAELAIIPSLAWLVTATRPKTQNAALRTTALIALGTCLVVWYGWMWWLGRFGSTAELRAVNLFMGPYAAEITWNWVIVGQIIPLALLLLPTGRSYGAQWIAFLAATWGSYAARIGIVIGGEALNRSGAGYYTFHLNFEELWYTGVSVLLFLGILAALLAVMPRDTQSASFTMDNKV